MALVLSRARLPQRQICTRCALQQQRACISAARAASGLRSLHYRGQSLTSLLFKRHVNSATNSSSDGLQSQRPLSIEDIRLRTEFEETKDIRAYLRKWQDTHPNILDPVRGPGTSNRLLDPSTPWVGTMLNDNRESHDAGSDALRVADDDTSEFSDIGDEGGGMHEFLEPGDLVALPSTDGLLVNAIYVRSVQKQMQFYTERGKWRIGYASDTDHVVKGFVSPESLAPILPHMPDSLAQLRLEMQSSIEGALPRPLGAHLLRKMHEFAAHVQDIYREHADTLDNLHAVVADEERQLEFTLEELAAKVLNIDPAELSSDVLFAVHQAVRRHNFLIESDRSSLFTDHYLVQPKRIAKMIDKVVTWVHEHQENLVRSVREKEFDTPRNHPLQQFLYKAQRLIRLSRKVRSPTMMSSVGPTAQRFQPGDNEDGLLYKEVTTERFNHNDRMIIEFLQLYCIPPRQMTSGPLRSAGSHIMRATGMYNTMGVSAASMPLFLQELGVFAPWENLRLLDQSLALPGHRISTSSERMWQEVQEACKEFSSGRLSDKMYDMRTDWGDLAVYCVDDAAAEEIDDGVSLERIPGSDDTFWIRVHVANPSAYISPEDVIMKYASSRYQTLYVPERTYPMLPSALTQPYFSLTSGRPTLTFSAKMNLSGDVLETDIRNGIARNVISITHATLRGLFEPTMDSESSETLSVGGDYTEKHSREGIRASLTPEDKDNFHMLRKLMLAFREHRLKNGAMEWPAPVNTTLSVSGGTSRMKPYDMTVEGGRYILGDPVIQLQSRDVDPYEVPDLSKRNLIALLMNLACWVSGKWLAERNIPSVYDGTWYHPEYPKLTNKNIAEYGGSNWLKCAAPKGVSSSSAVPHAPLGLDAYVKSTSPLRRYIDLIAHYQIEAALRFEKQNGRRLDASKDADAAVLPFSKADVDRYIARSRWKHARLRNVDLASKQFWACMLLFRAFYFAECDLPETFPCLLHKPYSNTALAGTQFGEGYAGVIPSLGVKCQVLFPDGFSDKVDILSLVEAKITAVDMSRMIVILEATRLVKHFERVGEWA